MLGWDQYGFDNKCIRTNYAKLLFLHPVGSAGHVVHFGSSGERIIDTIFFKVSWAGTDLIKSASGHVMLNLCFCIRWELWVTWCILMRPVRETSIHYFSCFSGTGTSLTKSASGHVVLNMSFSILWDLRVT
jgi:hypothetical protein